jgi:peptidoglycan hydrolase-like protein with peptidoglycan-binding domain
MTRSGALALLLAVGSIGWSLLGPASVAAAISPQFPDQGPGNRGADVRAAQGLLRQQGATIAVDGVFGASTVTAVRAFQAAAALPVTGRVDDGTWRRLVVRLETGSTGEAVRALQRQLNEKRGAGIVLDSVFGPTTRSAVLSFQRHMGLSPSGVVGALTWRYLLWHFERPVFGRQLCDYQVGNGPADWGTGAAIGQLEAAATRFAAIGRGRLAVGDIGLEHGGPIAGHQSHDVGLDVDIRPIRRKADQCRSGVNWRMAAYDRTATRALVRAIRATADGHVKVIYFNDPVLIREGLSRAYVGHDDHIHVRYCERVHRLAAFDC